MIVIDVGCARYGGDFSIERLIDEFKPSQLYGFDPNETTRSYSLNGCHVRIFGAAAWTYNGEIGYDHPGLSGWLTERRGAKQVRCQDLAEFIQELEGSGEIVLKIDAEGSEYGLLEHLIDRGVDKLLTLAWVEWHQPDKGRASLEERLACEVTEWRW